jgi:LysM repeat protein
VQSGDTLSGIAEKFDLPMQRIQDYNPEIRNIQALQIGDQIKIPLAPTATFTPMPDAAVGAGTPTRLAQYAPVTLLTPLDREIFIGGSSPILLQWLSAGILQPNELYRLEVERAGAPTITTETRATSYHLLVDQYPPTGDANRLFRWRVMIVRQTGAGNEESPAYRVVSPASESSFEWLDTVPTPTATATLRPGSRPAVQPSITPTPTP